MSKIPETKLCRMIGMDAVPMFNPLLYPSLLMAKPMFKGGRENWYSFAKAWENYLGIVKAASHGTEPDNLILLKNFENLLGRREPKMAAR